MGKLKNLLEQLVMVVIVLVLIQTFAEDLSLYLLFDWKIRKFLLISGFCFDLFFTIEFLTRYTHALIKGEPGEYLIHQRGWIDLLASLPLLLFNSGPALYFMVGGFAFTGGVGALNVLKVVKAVRVARILRMLRVLKIFKTIKSIDSVMTQRHVARIISTVVVSIIGAMFLFTLLFQTLLPSKGTVFEQSRDRRTLDYLLVNEDAVDSYSLLDDRLLLVKRRGQTLYSRYSDDEYNRLFGPGDYSHLESEGLEIFVDQRLDNGRDARSSMVLMITIIVTVLSLLFLYSPHFAMTVADPVFVMLKGMKNRDYNLEVELIARYRKDDIFRLSELYNDRFLTLKAREDDDEGGESLLSFDDFQF